MDLPSAYNVILGRPTLHQVKAVLALYLLWIQYKSDDCIMGKLFGDQCTTCKCYLVRIKPLAGPERVEELAGTRKP